LQGIFSLVPSPQFKEEHSAYVSNSICPGLTIGKSYLLLIARGYGLDIGNWGMEIVAQLLVAR